MSTQEGVAITTKNLKQILTFGVVGIINTLSDFVIFNFLMVVLHFPLLVANICAVSIVMTLSLYLNRRFVFGASGTKPNASQVAKFIGVTMVGLYIIQNSIIFIVLHAIDGAHMVTGIFANDIIQANIAKVIGVVGSAIWNFTLYKLWVFKKPAVEPAKTEAAND